MRNALLLLFLGCTSAAAQTTPAPEIAIEGLDPVLLTQGREAQGKNELSSLHEGLEYLFAAPESRALFVKEPRRYAAQLGGACARMGAPTIGNPDLYAVHEGRIYLFGSADCLRAFQSDPVRYLEPDLPPLARNADAERRARALLDKAVAWAGGAERLDGLAGYQAVTRLVQQRPAGELEIRNDTTVVFPASIRQEQKAPWGTYTSVVTPEDAFRITPRGAHPLHRLQRLRLEADELRTPLGILRSRVRAGFVAVHAGSASVDGVPTERVEVELSGLRITLGIEAASGRIVSLAYRGRASQPEGSVGEVTELFSDYRSVGGLMLAHRSTATIDGSPLRVVSLESVTLDPSVDLALFVRPGTR
jgi:YHS domain-containing protein